jgi:TRAP-type transport system periplasmic protein
VAWFEADSVRYTNETTKAALDLQEKQGIKVVNFGPEFKKIAVDLYWDDLKKLSPESIGKIQALLTK